MNIKDAQQILALCFPNTVREITSRHVLDAADELSSQWAVSIVARNGVPVDDAIATDLGDAVRAIRGRLLERRDALEVAFQSVVAGGKGEATLPPHTVEDVRP